MKKLLVLLIGIVAFSMVFTACGTPVVTPTNVESNMEQTPGEVVQKEEPHGDSVEENEPISIASKVEENGDEAVSSKESEAEKKPVETASKVTSKTTVSKVVEEQNFDACVGEADPTFTSYQGLGKWLLSEEVNVFEKERAQYITTMTNNQTIVYYKPTVDNDALIVIERIKVIPNHFTHYYSFKDVKYKNIQLSITEYTGEISDSLKENYENSLSEVAKGNPDYSMLGTEEMPILCHENKEMNSLGYIWYQHGGYQSALILCDLETLPPREYVIPYLNLEKVTLRTDTVTQ